MTGIERLRALSAGWDEMGLGGVLADVADQIERELSEERSRRSRDWREVSQVHREMRQRLFGHDSAGADLLSRWAERLLAAVCSSAAGDDAPVGAYDLLPEEEREAIAWVREHGGLEEVKARWTSHIPLSNVKRMVELHKAKRERLKAHALWLERKCHERRKRIKKLDKAIADMRPRLMPEGMEWLLEVWPKWSNGEYCKFGDWWKADEYSEREPSRLTKLSIYSPEQLREWEQDEGENYGYEWNFMRPADTTYRPNRVEPPAPKVLDADGVEIRVGDTVWDVETGCEFVVTKVADGTVFVAYEDVEADRRDPASLTHRAPVLAADGRPLREGETVWGTGREQHEYVVLGQPGLGGGTGRFKVACHDVTDDIDCDCDPSQLTHERPDSWERLEEDAEKLACEYFGREKEKAPCLGCRSREIDPCTAKDCEFNKTIDLVRRAKALAERDR